MNAHDLLEKLSWLLERASEGRVAAVLKALFVLALAFVLARLAAGALKRGLGRRLDAHLSMLLGRAVFYVIVALGLVSALASLGIDLTVLLGAAGILTVALGFASQTSASNLISGLFLIGERPFVVGETVRINGTTGEVIAIDLLSIKLRTFDNLFVRVPNETVLKAEVVNLSRFPIRRIDVPIPLAHHQATSPVRQLLLDAAHRTAGVLVEPAPTVWFETLDPASVGVVLSAWATRETYLETRGQLFTAVLDELRAAGVALAEGRQAVRVVRDA